MFFIYFTRTCPPDVHLCIFRKCENLFFHKGGFSDLGCILFNGEIIYYSDTIIIENNGYENNYNEI
jgi:hypothetical protein